MKDKYFSNATSKLYSKVAKLREEPKACKKVLFASGIWKKEQGSWLKKIFVPILTFLSICSLTPSPLIIQMPIKNSKIFCR